MSRGTLFYILSLIVCVGGVWLIVILGNRMRVAPDLSGRWVTPDGEVTTIEQSGRYVRLRLPDGAEPHLVLAPDFTDTAATGHAIKQVYAFDRPSPGALRIERQSPPPAVVLNLTRPSPTTRNAP